MCGSMFSAYDSAEEYRTDNQQYTFKEFKNEAGELALLVQDPEETDSDSEYDVVYPDGDTFGWDTLDACLTNLSNNGFKEVETANV